MQRNTQLLAVPDVRRQPSALAQRRQHMHHRKGDTEKAEETRTEIYTTKWTDFPPSSKRVLYNYIQSLIQLYVFIYTLFAIYRRYFT